MGKTRIYVMDCVCEFWEGLNHAGEIYPEFIPCEKHIGIRERQLEAEVAKWEKIANEEHAQSAHIAMRNGELQAENEGLKEKIEILKMIVLESPEAIRLVRGVLDEIDTTNKK